MAAGAKSTIFFVGIGLALLSLCYSLPNVDESKIVLASLHFKRQAAVPFPDDNDTCIANAIKSGAVSSSCINAIDQAGTDTTSAVCSSVCNSLYAVVVTCYGRSQTQAFYSAGCTNGYQGAAGRMSFNLGTILMSALTAALLKIMG